MNHRALKRMVCFLLMMAMLLSLLPAAFAAEETRSMTAPTGKYIITQTDYPLTKGVTETQVILNNESGTAQVYGYMTTVEPGASVKLKASYGGYYTEGSTPESRAEAAKNLKWDLRTTTGQAADYEKATGETVIMATNADYYNMQTAQCCGYLIMEGNVVQTSGGSAEPYFAVLKNGTYAIRDYGTPTDDVEEAISGPFFLLRNGEIVANPADTTLAPRNSIGLKADGTIVTFLADGRAGMSIGMTVYEVAQMMKEQGVVDAIYLDGGGSATVASRHEGSDKLSIQNHPSDGPERVVASTLLLVSTAEETGTFDHAALTPKNEVYMAGAQVQFLANGVDAGGYPSEIPTTAKWSLADDSFGTIDSTGLFKSNGNCGTVTANLIVSNKIVGTTSIEIQEPDEVFFPADSLNLAFNATSDLDLTVKYQSRLVNLGGVFLDWKINPLTEGKTAEEIGSFNGNLFTTVKAKETLKAEITVSYTKSDSTVLSDTITVEIGRMPEVFMDFEGKSGMSCAQYDWADARFYPEGWTPAEPITFMGYNAEKGGLDMITEAGPFFVDDWYNSNENGTLRYPSSTMFGAAGYELYTDHTGYMMKDSAVASYANAENGEVRFGEGSLRFDFDYSELKDGYKNVNCWVFITGDSYRSNPESSHAIKFDGTPSGLGCWVYAPEGTPNFWLWTKISYYNEDGVLKSANLHFKTQEGRNLQYTGIYWDGWMYCEADLTPYAKYVTPEHPLMIADGDYFINVTFIPGGSANENGTKIPMGDFAKGTLYFDNFRVVYGDTIDDMENPVISELSANGKTLGEETTTLDNGTVNITASFSDPVSDNATGIKTEKTALYIDGLKQDLTKSTETEAAAVVTLPNGTHSILLTVADGFGNVTKVTRYITIEDASSTFGTVSVQGESTAVLGESYALTMDITGSELVSELSATIALNNSFGEPTVTFENGYTGTASCENGNLTISAAAETPKSGTAVKITFAVDPATPRGTLLNYEVKQGAYTDGSEKLTFASELTTVGVTAAYELTTDIMVAGSTGRLYVTAADGSAPGRVEIYRAVEGGEPILLGTTNAAGVLVTNKLCQNVGESYTIYAKGEAGYSFRIRGTTNGMGSSEVTPSNIRLNAVTDPTTTQSITWFSAPEYTAKNAVVQYAEGALTKGDTVEYTTATGTSAVYAFNNGASDSNASLIHTVVLENLKPNTTYQYRVGDGVEGHWSELRQFTTAEEGADTSFFVMGDAQLSGSETAESPAVMLMEQIAENINKAEVDFGIQTGDFIDMANSLSRWDQILGIFGNEYPSTPVVQVLGNHEYYGDTTGKLANVIFDLPDKDYYSVEYGNVYVAVINCNASIEAAAKWLVEDAAKSDCTWKVLTLHQPPYYTNPKGSSDPYNKVIPSAAEAAGIDFVFSGHDHAYARTEPISAGTVNEKNGIVYFICGDLGEKSRDANYAPENNPDFHFATITQDYEAVYLLANCTDKEMTVTAYDADGTALDTYTKKLPEQPIDPPDPPKPEEHHYAYDRTADKLICTDADCAEEAPQDYTGWATDLSSGKAMYFLGGSYKTGWFQFGEEIYHFDKKTGEAHTLTVLEDIKTTCSEQGHKSVKCECGETYSMNYSLPAGHINQSKTTEAGETYYVCTLCGRTSKYDLTFLDVEDTDWFAPNIEYVVKAGLFHGRNAMTFDPNTPMSRAELVTVLWRNAGNHDSENATNTSFVDCATSSWYTNAVNWAAKEGIVNGVGENRFDPDGKVTREQLATILFRYAKTLGRNTEARADFAVFKDGSKVSSWAKEAMQWAVAEGIIAGSKDGGKLYLDPQGEGTRAQVATLLMRFIQNEE